MTSALVHAGTNKGDRHRPRLPTVARGEFLRSLAAEIPPEAPSPAEGFALLFAPLPIARRVARKVRLRVQVENMGVFALPYLRQIDILFAPPRPVPSLSRLNRSQVFPPLLLPEITLPTVKLSEILEIIRQAHADGLTWPRLLDLLATSSGFSWSAAATLLEKITGRTTVDEEVAFVAQARKFWCLHAEGRARLAALQMAKELPARQGDWAYFDREEFALLLPGAVLPDHFERHEFIANYVHIPESPSLDVYTVTGQPLFQHRFVPPFRSLL